MHRSAREEARQCARAASLAREAASAFLESDVDNDGSLSWSEFQAAVGRLRTAEPQMLCEADVRSLFEALNTDGDDRISMNEYFLWIFELASRQGIGLECVFRKHDASGMIDAMGFTMAVEELGFSSAFAYDLFAEVRKLDQHAAGSDPCIWARVAYSLFSAMMPDPLRVAAVCTSPFNPPARVRHAAGP